MQFFLTNIVEKTGIVYDPLPVFAISQPVASVNISFKLGESIVLSKY